MIGWFVGGSDVMVVLVEVDFVELGVVWYFDVGFDVGWVGV